MSPPQRGSALPAIFVQGFSDILERAPVADEIDKFQQYLELLLQWNRAHRLTAYRHPEDIVQKLLLDSLFFLKVLPSTARRLLDFGTGAGIPGIPLKIVSPHIALTLVETRRNRSSFLATVLRDLDFKGVTLLRGRAEQLLPDLEGTFDGVVVRAVSSPAAIIPVAVRFLAPGGVLIGSGPPLRRKRPALPEGSSTSWKLIPSPLSGQPRQFWVVQKEY